MASHRPPEKLHDRMPWRWMERRAEAFGLVTNRKGLPLTFGTGKPEGKKVDS